MTIEQIANRLVELCLAGEFETCYQELYSDKIVSIEPKGALVEKAVGMDEIRAKGKKWQEMVERVNGQEIGNPIIAGDHFAIPWKLNVTFKGAPGPTDMNEICVYQVADGKIVLEQFFYTNS